MTGSLSELAQKVAAGQALAPDEARRLAETPDLVTVGMIATEARRKHVGEGVTFVRVFDVPFDAPLPEGGCPASARELRLTGEPASADEAIAAVRRLAAGAGEGTTVTAFALAYLWRLAGGDAGSLETLARALRDAGVTAVAETTLDELTANDLRAALAALIAGGLTAPVASWRDAPADPVAAYAALRTLQAELKTFRAVAPLPLRRPGPSDTPSTGYDDVKLVAIARVMLNNVEHVQVDWSSHGPKLAQVALLFGASDLDRVSPSDASPLGHRRAPLEEVQRNITAAFLTPFERDGLFQRVAR